MVLRQDVGQITVRLNDHIDLVNNMDLEDLIKTTLFIPLLIGFGMLPVIGVYALALIVPFGCSLQFLHCVCEADRRWIAEGEGW